MSRTALARKHRPRRFGELVGQDHVASTLRAAVEGDRVGHAYLFCGPRGVGKTTAARVLAMALNCPEREAGEPCGSCESCDRIWSGRTSLDVVEIDAASNRGVDDARDLRERAMYAPSDDERYKVYIVDEAHMLTREAWNALLKILEEPPPRVIFAFATTEPGKIQQTAAPVLSRCQRFDFHRVAVPEIIGRMETVMRAEGVEADPDALLPIARHADGGVRDALSLLDQVLSFSGDEVRSEDVRRMLGLVEEERYLEFFDLAAEGDRAGVFPFVQRLVDAGYDPAAFVRGLGDALRILLALCLDPESEAVELPEESRPRFREASERFRAVDLLRLLMAASDFEASGRFRRSGQQRIQLELLLLRLVSMDSAVELEDLLRAAGGEAPETGRRAGGGGSGAGGGGSGADGGAGGGTGSSGGSRPAGGGGDGPRAGGSRPVVGGAPSAAAPTAGPTVAESAAAGSASGGGPEDGGASGESASDGGPEAGRADESGLEAAWRGALREAGNLGGRAVALRSASLEAASGGALVVRDVPAGLAEELREFLGHPGRSAPLRSALAERLSLSEEEVSLEIETPEGTARVTEETARDLRLQELMKMDPTLRAAVEELDLTIKE